MPHQELAGPPVSRAGPVTPERSVLSRVAGGIGRGALSFFRDVPVDELQRRSTARDIDEQALQLNQQQIEANQADVLRGQRQQELQQMISGGDPAQRNQALAQLSVEFPEMFEQISENAGLRTQGQKNEAADFGFRARNTPFDQRQPLIDQRITKLISEGRDPQHTASLTGLSEEEQDISLRATELLALSPEDRVKAARGTVEPFALQTFRGLVESAGLEGEEIEEAARVALGVDPRAVGSAEQTIAVNEQLSEMVAELRETLAERTKFAERTGASRAATIDKGFASIGNINKNIRNIDRAITALEGGASTGAIESRFFPSIRESSVILDQIQGELALDVVGSVTFGALSKGELDLARSTALPTSLQPPELIAFLQEKRTAQEKLRIYYDSQIQHLDQGGTIASFLQQQRDGQVEDTPEGTTTVGRFTVETVP